jgi:AraC-like DNA-binding protein
LAKIAIELERALAERARNGAAGGLTTRTLAQGDGWSVDDVLCTSGPRDRSYAEQHDSYRIAVVVAGSFQCRAESLRELLTPGSLLLFNADQWFECGHEHSSGDRCVSFAYSPEFFERVAADAGLKGGRPGFRRLRLAPACGLASLVAEACTGLTAAAAWDELSVRLAGRAVPLAAGTSSDATDAPPSAVARVTRAVRLIDRDPSAQLTLKDLAREAGLSLYHFLRVFESLTGVTPHQYVRRARLRDAATQLAAGHAKILDIALDCGFGDATNFNRAFRAEFGISPRAYRAKAGVALHL